MMLVLFKKSCTLGFWGSILLFLPLVVSTVNTRHEDHKIVNSTLFKEAQISFKQVSLCLPTSSTAKGFAGYVHLPVDTLRTVGLDQQRPINTFFWFFESQNDLETVPLTVYSIPLLRENGPCRVDLTGRSTHVNPWSWNQVSNMLYIDQPVNTGFSYDVLMNATMDIRGNWLRDENLSKSSQGDSRMMSEPGIIGEGAADADTAVNTTEAAVRALWVTLTTWLQDFPEFESKNHEIELWTASYGGHYAPALYDFARTKASKDPSVGPQIRFRTIGLMNACVDSLAQLPAYPEMAYNNTYGLKLINETTYRSAMRSWDEPGGCRSRIQACRGALGPTPYLGANTSMNAICHEANTYCGWTIANLVADSSVGFFDIGYPSRYLSDPNLHTYYAYLKQQHVLDELGVPVNFTDQSNVAADAFTRTGDNLHGDYVAVLGRAIDDGVHVHLIYGDRDYACNWLGGEALSTAIPHKHAEEFRSAGYEAFQIPAFEESDEKANAKAITTAYVRQHGNLSFTMVLNSGHTVNTAQPSTGFAIFNRTIANVDIVSGMVSIGKNSGPAANQSLYSTQGPTTIRHVKNTPPAVSHGEEGMCYSLALSQCSERQLTAYLTGKALVRDYWVVDLGDRTCSPNPIQPCTEKSRLGDPQVHSEEPEQETLSITYTYTYLESRRRGGMQLFIFRRLAVNSAGMTALYTDSPTSTSVLIRPLMKLPKVLANMQLAIGKSIRIVQPQQLGVHVAHECLPYHV
ncbi:hypothetical protein FHL15_011263 [Xylaria flabelliformis]|uniref:Carboxypeptidase n=1 Tax=Xylaria flabelliformis TaxID=2512241 RepID=A0A553HIQ4_9PEZI|nr:hypothetical protein FHL15_011263 [Xylaria flabelliformis]